MSFFGRTKAQIKVVPKIVLIAAVILPFGLIAVGTWIVSVSFLVDARRRKKK